MAGGPGPALGQTSLSFRIIGARQMSQTCKPLQYKGYKGMPSTFIWLAEDARRCRRCEPHTTCHMAVTRPDALHGREFPMAAKTPPAIRPLARFPRKTLGCPCCITSETHVPPVHWSSLVATFPTSDETLRDSPARPPRRGGKKTLRGINTPNAAYPLHARNAPGPFGDRITHNWRHD